MTIPMSLAGPIRHRIERFLWAVSPSYKNIWHFGNGLFLFVLFSFTLATAFDAPAKPLPSPRIHQLLDADWQFHRGDAPEGWNVIGYDRSAALPVTWEPVDLPHDWSIQDLPSLGRSNSPALSITVGAWRFKPGDDAAWKDPNLDDSAWQQVTLPAHWSVHSKLSSPHSFGWYRRRLTIPLELKGQDVLLLIGKVDDVDETFVNGEKVGGMGSFPPNYATAWEATRRYLVPARLLKGDGTDVIAIRDYNGEGDAGLYEAAAAPHRSGPFDSEAEGGTAQGYTEGGIGLYTKDLHLPNEMRGKQLTLTFDGVYMNSEVWLNGHSLGKHPYGYTSFSYDITPYVRSAAEGNILGVRVDSSGRTSRWYSGSGIFRHVWLTATGPVHVGQWGVFVSTPRVTEAQATALVRTTIQNSTGKTQTAVVTSRILDPAGKVVATMTGRRALPPGSAHDIEGPLTVDHPQLWSPDGPALYRLLTTITVGGKVTDEVETPFGIRSIVVDAVHGFMLNGKPLKLRGGCVHHDNGPLGSAAFDRAEERRVELLKASGYNAIRTSHNPPSPAFLDACDRQGILVMDEAFDCWRHGKNGQDYGRFFDEWWKTDLDSMVLRDRNHPSVVLWSLGNEIPEQNSPEGAATCAQLTAEVRALDTTRPVAQATNPDANKLDPLLENLDVCGYNYASGRYASDHEQHPARVFAGTESTPEGCFDQWMAVVDHPYVIGDFVWTALDYLGEAGIGKAVPQSSPPGKEDTRLWTVSNCGDLDLDGEKRAQSYYRNAVWGVGPRVSAFVEAPGPDGKPERVEGWGWRDERPSWTWPGREGQTVTVRVYSSAPHVQLLLNGKDLGTKETNRANRFTATWEVPYTPGELTAEAVDGPERLSGFWTLRTAGPPASLRLTPDRKDITADGQDLSYVTVEVVDAKGVLDPNAAPSVHFDLTGPGKIIAVSNADPRNEESFQGSERKAFCGRCMVIIRAGTQPGDIHLTARVDGLPGAETVIRTERPAS